MKTYILSLLLLFIASNAYCIKTGSLNQESIIIINDEAVTESNPFPSKEVARTYITPDLIAIVTSATTTPITSNINAYWAVFVDNDSEFSTDGVAFKELLANSIYVTEYIVVGSTGIIVRSVNATSTNVVVEQTQ